MRLRVKKCFEQKSTLVRAPTMESIEPYGLPISELITFILKGSEIQWHFSGIYGVLKNSKGAISRDIKNDDLREARQTGRNSER